MVVLHRIVPVGLEGSVRLFLWRLAAGEEEMMPTFNLQAAIDAQVAGGGGVVEVPPGMIEIPTTISITQVRGIVIRGQGAIATDLG
jgi:hypothetical protein